MKIKEKYKIIIVGIIIFSLALFFRVSKIDRSSQTSDEKKWLIRSSDFVSRISKGDFINSTREFEKHPGIPHAFLMGIFINSLATPDNYEVKNLVTPFPWSLKIINPLEAARMATAIIGSLSALILFWFCSKIWNLNIGILAGLILALNPFHIALSRIAHQDVILGFFIMCSLFCYYLGEKENKTSYKIWAGIFFGFAFLTKIVALFIPLIIFIWKFVINFKKGNKKYLFLNSKDIIALIIGIVMFFVFYPSMWQNIVSSFINHIKINTDPKEIKDTYFYFGEVRKGPNPTFYLLSSIVRFQEIYLIAVAAYVLLFLKNIFSIKKIKKIDNIYFLLLSWFLVFYIVFSCLGKIKDRYFIVVWPIFAILISLPLAYFINFAAEKLRLNHIKNFLSITFVLIISLPSLIFLEPYYSYYYNRLIPKNAIMQVLPLSHDEGIKEAAEFLNNISGNKKVLSSLGQMDTYLKGEHIKFDERPYEKKQKKYADFIVWHLKNTQQHYPAVMYEEYVFKLNPFYTIKINNIDTAYIYTNPYKKQ